MPPKIIAFDADDTLFVNEPYFQEMEHRFCQIMSPYLSQHAISQALFEIEIKNLSIYGYGIKGYILSMIEAALQISDQTISVEAVEKIIGFGKELLEKPIELLDGVAETLHILSQKYTLVVATKGDLLDQQNKLQRSGIAHFFHHIEVMSDKKIADYQKLLNHLDIDAKDFAMVGNSLKSDILPVLELGATAFYVPFHTTWAHEKVNYHVEHQNLKTFEKIIEILKIL